MKRRLRTQINPEKSNKMIIAVGIGLLIVVVVLFLIFVDLSPPTAEKLQNRYGEQVRQLSGFLELEFGSDGRAIRVVYDPLVNPDFPRRFRILVKSLSRQLPDRTFQVSVFRSDREEAVSRYNLQNGR